MESTSKRLLVAFLLLVVFVVGVKLRFTGLDWALHDGGTPHPDERHVNNCINHMYLEPVPARAEDESYWEYLKRYWGRQLIERRTSRQGTGPPLRPVNYNYGTFPFYCYKIVQAMTADDWSHMTHPTVRLVLLVIFFLLVLRFCWTMRPTEAKPGTYLKILPLCILLPLLGLIALALAPWLDINLQNIAPRGYTGIILIGRLVTALCGSLTVLLLYLIGRDAYGRWTGLLAAAFLGVAVLHVQLSHFATVDIMVAFWIVAAIFCFHRIALRPRLIYYVLGAVATGFAVGSKWSAVTLPGIFLLAHAIGTWFDERHGQTGRWINTIWLILFGAILIHFFRAASSTQPTFNLTLAAFRDFYVLHRWHLALLCLGIFLISVFLLYCQSWWRGDGRWGSSLLSLYRPWLFLLIAVPVGMGALFIAEPLAFLDSAAFARDVCEQHGIIVTGERPVPYTQQYAGTMPIFYSLDNLFYPSFDSVTAFFALAGLIFSIFMALRNRHRSDILLLAWVLPNFFLYSTFLCKFPRYLITVVPFLLLFGARLLVAMASIRPAFYSAALATWPMWAIRGAKRAGIIGILLSLLCGVVYAFAFVGIYNRPHTYRHAADWLRDNGAHSKRILSQSWDEWLPGVPKVGDLQLHTTGDSDLSNTLSALAQADYLVLPSKRAYGTTFRLPKRFPLINRFFRLLFSEQLGYELAASITSEPIIGFGESEFLKLPVSDQPWPRVSLYNLRWELSSDLEDESFRVYDHPKVVIFRNVKRLKASQMRAAVMDPPAWLEKVTWGHILRARAGRFILQPESKWPALSWYLGLQLLSVCAFIFVFPACSALRDRGYALSKILGLILFSWISWLLASTGLFPLSRAQLFAVLLFVIGFAILIGFRRRADLRSYWLENRRLIVGMEILFLVIWWIFLCIRAHHPDVYWGEKPMEFSFINAIYCTSVFPPIDPWISGRPINYYYYGYVVYALLGRLLAIPPAYVFNLGVTTAPALLGIASFGLIYNVCRSWKAGVLGSYLILFSGHLVSYGRFIQSHRQWIEDDSTATGVLPALADWFKYLPLALKTVLSLFLSALGFLERAPAETLRFLQMHRGTYFWKCGHDVIPGTVANEFPCWSFYFSDFHPHVMVMPMTVAALGLMLALLMRGGRSNTEYITSRPHYGILWWFALVMGTVICTNTWDFPALMLVLSLVLLIRFVSLSPLVGARIQRGSWVSPSGLSVLACDLFVPLVAVLFVAWVLFVPFHSNFVSRVTGVGWMTEGNTPASTMLAFFGILLWPGVVLLLWRVVFGEGLRDIRWKRLAVLVLLFAVSAVAARYVNQRNPFGYPPAHTSIQAWALPSDYTSAALLLPFVVISILLALKSKRSLDERFVYLLGLLGLGILFGCEFLYVREGWSEPSHRWNTVFKFYLQAWIYLGLFAGVAACLLWRDLRVRVSGTWRLVRCAMRVAWAAAVFALLLASVVFPIAGAYSVTLAGDTNDNRGLIPSLDGMSYMVQSKPDEYRAIQFINYAFDGTPVILEAHGMDRQYQEFSRVSMNTGCPTVLGWAHHVGERLHGDEIPTRWRAVDQIYNTRSVDDFIRLIGAYDVDYVYYGKMERQASPGCERRWRSWGHVLDLVARFDLGPSHSHTSIYAARKNINALRGITMAESPTAAPLAQREPGRSMFEGGPGIGNGQFQEPRGLCFDSKNRVYVTDTRNYRLQVFQRNGQYFGQIGVRGQDAGQFEEPMDVAVDGIDRVYVLDTWNHRVQVFDTKGELQRVIARDFYGPRGIAIDPKANLLYVTDTGHHVVKVFDTNGRFIRLIGDPAQVPGSGEGQFHAPVGIDVTADGRVVVADTLNDRIQFFNKDGRYLVSWPVGFTIQPNRGVEAHLAAAPDGTIYVADPLAARVLAFSPDGDKVGTWDRASTGEQFRMPNGLALTRDGELLVTDLHRHKVMRLRIQQ